MKKIYGCNLLEIVITAAILLLAGSAGAVNQINSCTTDFLSRRLRSHCEHNQ